MIKGHAPRFVFFLFFYALLPLRAFALDAPTFIVQPSGWQKEVPVFSWTTVKDAVSYEVAVDSAAAWQNVGAKTVFKPEMTKTGIHSLYVRAIGKDGKPGKNSKITFGLDLTPPKPPQIYKTDPPADGNWTAQKEFLVYWHKSIEDIGSGRDYYAGQIDSGEMVKITENPWKVTLTDGQHTVKIYAYDKAGNQSEAAQVTLQCDTLPPSPPQIISNTATAWSNNPTPQLEVQSEDSGSGVAYYEYVADNALDGLVSNIMWVKVPEGKNIFTVEPALSTGEYEIWVRATDKMGHVSEPTLARSYIDINPPEFSGALTAVPAEPTSALKLKVTWDRALAKDKESGIASFQGSYDDVPTIANITTDTGWNLALTKRELTPIRVWAVDNAGNKSAPVEIKYDVKKKEKELKLQIKSEKEKNVSFLQSLDYTGTKITRTFKSVSSPGRTVAEGLPVGSTWEQSMLISVRGLLGSTKIHVQIEDNPSQQQKVLIELEGKHLYTKLGNFSTTFGAGEFASFTKEIEGVEVGAKYKPVDAKIVFSKGTSFQRTDTFQGLNIKGPYRVSAFNLLQGSENLYLNKNDGSGERLLVRELDYDIDYFGGYITFREIINSNWTVRASYEYSFLDLFFRTGEILGATTTLKFLPQQTLSLSWLKETSKSAEAALSVTQTAATETFTGLKGTTLDSTEEDIQKEYPLANWPIVDRTETISQNRTIVKHSSLEKALFGGKFDYYIDYNRGTIIFVKEGGSLLTPPPPVEKDEIQATYTYRISFSSSGKITSANIATENQPTDAFYSYTFLSQVPGIPSTGYAKEKLRIWRLNPDGTKKDLLKPDWFVTVSKPKPHYTIDVPNGRLKIFKDANPAPQPNDVYLVEYRALPQLQQTGGEKPSERKVFGITHSIKLFKSKLTLDTEYATSQADKDSFGTKKAETLKCGQKISDTPLTFQLDPLGTIDAAAFTNATNLQVAPLVPALDTVKNVQRLLTRVTGTGASGEYFIDYNTARIIFQSGFTPKKGDGNICKAQSQNPDDKTENTDVSVDYFYFPSGVPISSIPTPVKGSAFKIKSQLNLGKLQLGIGYRKVEAKYIPVGATKPPPELGEYTADINYQIHKSVSLSGNYDRRRTPKVDTNLELTGEETKSTTGTTNMRLAFHKLPTVSLSYSLQTNVDNQPVHAVDTKNTSKSIDISYKIGDLDTAFNFRKTDTLNNVPNGASIKENSFDSKLNFVPSPNFNTSFGFQLKNVESIAPTLTSQSRTRFMTSTMLYKPSHLITLNSTMNSTNVKDQTHPAGYTINNATIGLRLSPFEIKQIKLRKKPWTVNSIGITLFLEKNPTEIPATVTRNTGLTLSHTLIPSLTFDHNWSFSRSSREGLYENKTNSFGTTTSFTPSGKLQFQLKFNFNESGTLSKTITQTGGGAQINETKSRTSTKGLELSLLPFPRLRTTMNYTLSETKTLTGAASSSKSTTPWIELNYTVGPRLTLITRFQQSKQNAAGRTTTRNDLTLTGNWRLNKNSLFALEVKKVSFNDSENAKVGNLNYSATLVTGRVELSF